MRVLQPTTTSAAPAFHSSALPYLASWYGSPRGNLFSHESKKVVLLLDKQHKASRCCSSTEITCLVSARYSPYLLRIFPSRGSRAQRSASRASCRARCRCVWTTAFRAGGVFLSPSSRLGLAPSSSARSCISVLVASVVGGFATAREQPFCFVLNCIAFNAQRQRHQNLKAPINFVPETLGALPGASHSPWLTLVFR